jgi:hypothetical protein
MATASRALRPSLKIVALEDVGETNVPTVGPNFLHALEKGFAYNGAGCGPLLKDLRSLHYNKAADYLGQYADVAVEGCPVEARENLFRALAEVYTWETTWDKHPQTGKDMSLYKEMNWAIRTDDERVKGFALFIAFILWGNPLDPQSANRSVVAPASMAVRKSMRTARGFAVDPEVLSRYSKGTTFLWQAFVSTSKNPEKAAVFADGSAKEQGGGKVALVFDIDLPAGSMNFYAFELAEVSEYPDEAEVLLMPYTRFVVVDKPEKKGSVWHIHLRAIDIPFWVPPSHINVLVDPGGFETGENYELAKAAFSSGLPQLRASEQATARRMEWGMYYDCSRVEQTLSGMGVFTSAEAAVEWMKTGGGATSEAVFHIVVSGRASTTLLDEYFKATTPNPCSVFVLCRDASYWQRHWSRTPRITVSSDRNAAAAFMQHKVYKLFSNGSSKYEAPSRTHMKGQQVWFPWKRVNGGVVYGGGDRADKYVPGNPNYEQGWNQGTGVYPEVSMPPFDGATPHAALKTPDAKSTSNQRTDAGVVRQSVGPVQLANGKFKCLNYHCTKPSWDGSANQYCSSACRNASPPAVPAKEVQPGAQSRGAVPAQANGVGVVMQPAGPVQLANGKFKCLNNHCAKPSWDGSANQYCSSACKNASPPAVPAQANAPSPVPHKGAHNNLDVGVPPSGLAAARAAKATTNTPETQHNGSVWSKDTGFHPVPPLDGAPAPAESHPMVSRLNLCRKSGDLQCVLM